MVLAKWKAADGARETGQHQARRVIESVDKYKWMRMPTGHVDTSGFDYLFSSLKRGEDSKTAFGNAFVTLRVEMKVSSYQSTGYISCE